MVPLVERRLRFYDRLGHLPVVALAGLARALDDPRATDAAREYRLLVGAEVQRHQIVTNDVTGKVALHVRMCGLEIAISDLQNAVAVFVHTRARVAACVEIDTLGSTNAAADSCRTRRAHSRRGRRCTRGRTGWSSRFARACVPETHTEQGEPNTLHSGNGWLDREPDPIATMIGAETLAVRPATLPMSLAPRSLVGQSG